MNKRQVLDIVLIIFGIYFLMYFIQSTITTTYVVLMQENQFVNRGSYMLMLCLYLLIPPALSAVFLFQREKLLNVLIGKSEQQESPQTDSLPCYGRLAFWLQILGLYYIISSVVRVISRFPVIVSRSSQYVVGHFWWQEMGNSIVTIIVASLIIWKSEVIANFINKITKQSQPK